MYLYVCVSDPVVVELPYFGLGTYLSRLHANTNKVFGSDITDDFCAHAISHVSLGLDFDKLMSATGKPHQRDDEFDEFEKGLSDCDPLQISNVYVDSRWPCYIEYKEKLYNHLRDTNDLHLMTNLDETLITAMFHMKLGPSEIKYNLESA